MIFIKKEIIVIIELFKDNTQQDQLISIKVWQIWHSDYEKTIDYYYLRNKPGRNILVGLVNGMARGLGIAIGITVLAFIVYYILKSLQVMDLPFIGNFIADLLDYIEDVRNISI